MCPDRLAGRRVVTGDDLIVAALLLGIEQVLADREGRPGRSDRPAPQLAGRRGGPVRVDANATDDAVALGAAKAGPFGSCCDGCQSGRFGLRRWCLRECHRLAPSGVDGLVVDLCRGCHLGNLRRGRSRWERRRSAPSGGGGLAAGLGQEPLLAASSSQRQSNFESWSPLMPSVRTERPRSASEQNRRRHRRASRSICGGDGCLQPRRPGQGTGSGRHKRRTTPAPSTRAGGTSRGQSDNHQNDGTHAVQPTGLG